MSTPPTEQARIAAAAQLRATLLEYFAQEYWTPLEGCLIVSGIHPIPDCTEIPLGGVGLDNKPLKAGSSRFHDARHMWDTWGDYRESQLEEGEDVPDHLTPMDFMGWVDDESIETGWLPVFHELMERNDGSDKPDFIPSAIARFASEALMSVDTLVSRIESIVSNDKPAMQASPGARSPMPIPENRDHVSTEELAAILAVEPQSIRKRYNETGSYHGIRPTKLPSRRLLWPVDEARKLLDGKGK